MQSPVLRVAMVELSICLSVCPSITRWHCVKTTQVRITKSSPTDGSRTSLGNKKLIQKLKSVDPEWGH